MNFIYYIFISLLLFSACTKTEVDANQSGSIQFSLDTLRFDTLINGLESPVKTLKIFNQSQTDIVFSSIQLNNKTGEIFKLNVHGKTGNSLEGILVPAQDSIYLFVTLEPNKNESNEIYELNNEIKFIWNGIEKNLPIQAFAIPVIPLKDITLSHEFIFEKNKNYFIQGKIEIPTNLHLSIPEGVKIYAYPNAEIIVYGSIEINGTPENRVLITSYRKDLPVEGSWEGLRFMANGKTHTIKNTTIHYAKQGINYIAEFMSTDFIELDGIQIQHSSGIGLHFTNISANITNSLITNNAINLNIQGGGNYEITHLTTASYSSMTQLHLSPSLIIKDQLESGTTFPLKILLLNSIIWGDLMDEISHELVHAESETVFENTIYKSTQTQTPIQYIDSYNIDPIFEEIDISKKIYNFRITDSSPAIDLGKTTLINQDILGNLREDGKPDLGCYEFIHLN